MELFLNIFSIVSAVGTVAAAIVAAVAVKQTANQNKRLEKQNLRLEEQNQRLVDLESDKHHCNIILYSEYHKDKLQDKPLARMYRRNVKDAKSDTDESFDDNDEHEMSKDDQGNYERYAEFCVKNHGDAVLKKIEIKFSKSQTSEYSVVLAKDEARYIRIGIPKGVDSTKGNDITSAEFDVEFTSCYNDITSGRFRLREIKVKDGNKKKYTVKSYSFEGKKITTNSD